LFVHRSPFSHRPLSPTHPCIDLLSPSSSKLLSTFPTRLFHSIIAPLLTPACPHGYPTTLATPQPPGSPLCPPPSPPPPPPILAPPGATHKKFPIVSSPLSLMSPVPRARGRYPKQPRFFPQPAGLTRLRTNHFPYEQNGQIRFFGRCVYCELFLPHI